MKIKIRKKNLESKVFYDMERDGLTQSSLSMWLSCREKARLYFQGWDSRYHKEALIDGNIGHAGLEFAYLDIKAGKLKGVPSLTQARHYIDQVEKRWFIENPKPNSEARQYVQQALAISQAMLPLYFDFWKDDFKKKQWVSLEEKFRLPFQIGVGKNAVTIPLRGKKDGTFRTSRGLWLFETKFKAMISEGDIAETLSFETQVMLYMMEVWKGQGEVPRGCLYNIVRRPGLRIKSGENLVAFVKRIKEDVEKRPEFYFMRMESPTSLTELEKFRAELEQLVTDMYRWWRGVNPHYKNTYSCTGKYGKCLYLPVCARKDYASLIKRTTIFKELEDF